MEYIQNSAYFNKEKARVNNYLNSRSFWICMLMPVILLIILPLTVFVYASISSNSYADETHVSNGFLYGFDRNSDNYFTDPEEVEKENLTVKIAKFLVLDLADWLNDQAFGIDRVVYGMPDYLNDEEGNRIYTYEKRHLYDEDGRHQETDVKVFVVTKPPVTFSFSDTNPFGHFIHLTLRPIRGFAVMFLVVAGQWLAFKWVTSSSAVTLSDVKEQVMLFALSYVLMYIGPVLFNIFQNFISDLCLELGGNVTTNFIAQLEVLAKTEGSSIGDTLLYLAGSILGALFSLNYLFMNITLSVLISFFSIGCLRGGVYAWKETVGGLTKQILSLSAVPLMDGFGLLAVSIFVTSGLPLLYQVAAMACILPIRTVIRGVFGVGGNASEMMGIGFMMMGFSLMRSGMMRGASGLKDGASAASDYKDSKYYEKRSKKRIESTETSKTTSSSEDTEASDMGGQSRVAVESIRQTPLPSLDMSDKDAALKKDEGSDSSDNVIPFENYDRAQSDDLRQLDMEHAFKNAKDHHLGQNGVVMSDAEKAHFYRNRAKKTFARTAGRTVGGMALGSAGAWAGAISLSALGPMGIAAGGTMGYKAGSAIGSRVGHATGGLFGTSMPVSDMNEQEEASEESKSSNMSGNPYVYVAPSGETTEEKYAPPTVYSQSHTNAEFVNPTESHISLEAGQAQGTPALDDPAEVQFRGVSERFNTFMSAEMPDHLREQVRKISDEEVAAITKAYDIHQAPLDNQSNMDLLSRQFGHNDVQYGFNSEEGRETGHDKQYYSSLEDMNKFSKETAIRQAVENAAIQNEVTYKVSAFVQNEGATVLKEEHIEKLKDRVSQNLSNSTKPMEFENEVWRYRKQTGDAYDEGFKRLG